MPSVETTLLAAAAEVVPAQAGEGAAIPAARPAGLGGSIVAEIVSEVSTLMALRAEWDALFERAGAAHQVFQTHGFVSLWTDAFVEPMREGLTNATCACQPAIVTLRRNGRLVLVWPLVLQRRFGLRILSWLGEPFAQYADAIVDPEEAAGPALEAAWRHVLAAYSPDLVRLRRVRGDATVMQLLRSIGAMASNRQEAPFVALGPASGANGFQDRQSGKARKNRRRLMRRLEEQGKVGLDCVEGTAHAQRLAAEALAAKRDWVIRRGLLAPALSDSRFDALMCAAAGPGAAATGCSVYALTIDGRTAATAVGFRCKDRLMLHLITHTAEVERFGAGVLNLEHVMRTAEAEGLVAVDLLPPTADYKLDWADGTMAVADYTIAPTAAGRLYTALVDELAKPLVRGLFDVLPLATRQWLARRQFRHGCR